MNSGLLRILLPRVLGPARVVTSVALILYVCAEYFTSAQIPYDIELLTAILIVGVLELASGIGTICNVAIIPSIFLFCMEMAFSYFVAEMQFQPAPLFSHSAAVGFCFIFLVFAVVDALRLISSQKNSLNN